MRPIRIAIIGFGKIAADQHVPASEGNDRFELVATSSRSGVGLKRKFTDWRKLLDEVELEAVAITTPPSARHQIARACLERGLHVLMEKPPTVTLGETQDLVQVAASRDLTLFASWHAQHNPAVTAAGEALAGERIASMAITWHEDVHKWHPGQTWIWEPGGFGVFDPGINAFSIATRIFPGELFVREATLDYPSDAQAPIAAEIVFGSPAADGPITCSLDWRRSEGEEWTIAVETASGREIRLENGGGRLLIDGEEQPAPGIGEYPDIYRTFVDLIDERRSQVDLAPLRLVADTLLVGARRQTDPIIG